jgi:hypothetical protein
MNFLKKHWVAIVLFVVSNIFTFFLTKYAQHTMPTIAIDRRTGNYLYIGRPIGHSEPHGGYYEFPVTLNDGKGEYRIDKYDLMNKALIIKKSIQ